jgi:hypothetical protein
MCLHPSPTCPRGHRRSHSSNLPQSQSQSHAYSGISEPLVPLQPLVQHATATLHYDDGYDGEQRDG